MHALGVGDRPDDRSAVIHNLNFSTNLTHDKGRYHA
jgi:hypothetical protein